MIRQFNQMCNIIPNYLQQIVSPEITIGIIGLHNSGKSTLKQNFQQKHPKDIELTGPTIGLDSEKFIFKNQKYQTWELGGKCNNIEKMQYHIPKTDILVLVINSFDQNRMDELKQYMLSFLNNDRLQNIPLLVYLNHENINHQKLSAQYIQQILNLDQYCQQQQRKYYIQNCNALAGNGVFEGFKWIHGQKGMIKRRKN